MVLIVRSIQISHSLVDSPHENYSSGKFASIPCINAASGVEMAPLHLDIRADLDICFLFQRNQTSKSASAFIPQPSMVSTP
jgi:hypothetical protein